MPHRGQERVTRVLRRQEDWQIIRAISAPAEISQGRTAVGVQSGGMRSGETSGRRIDAAQLCRMSAARGGDPELLLTQADNCNASHSGFRKLSFLTKLGRLSEADAHRVGCARDASKSIERS